MNWYHIFQTATEQTSLWCLAALAIAFGIGLLAYLLAPIVTWLRSHCLDAFLIAPFVVGIIFYGSTKITTTITYPRTDPEVWYLQNNGSYVTNDAVHIAFTRNLIVPQTANFFIYGLDCSYTNQSDWADYSFMAYSNTFQNMSVPFDFVYQYASNFNWIAFTDWTPPPVTHTNGVAYVAWQIGTNKSINDIVPYRTGIYTNSVRLSPSHAITNGPNTTINLLSTPQQETQEQ